jgi:hypothetical protein
MRRVLALVAPLTGGPVLRVRAGGANRPGLRHRCRRVYNQAWGGWITVGAVRGDAVRAGAHGLR